MGLVMVSASTHDRAESEGRIPYVDLPAQYAEDRDEIDAAIRRVFEAGDFVGGAAVAELEARLAEACGVAEAVAVGSGTDALILTLRATGIGPGDEVLAPPNSFVASASCIAAVGATPVFVDVASDQNIDPACIEAAITPRTRAILPVHLTGRIAEMEAIRELADANGLRVIEDAAQAMGSVYHGRAAGSLGDAGCFSTHPLKNLNAAGDGGFVKRVDIQAEFTGKLQDILKQGVGNLVDADLAEESANLQAFQIKQQLGVQALAIANAGPQSILALFA